MRKLLVLGFLVISFCPLSFGQTKAIHFSVNDVKLGQSISSSEIKSHFRDYEETDFGGILQLLFKNNYTYFDGIPIPINKIRFVIKNGVLQEIELRTPPLDARDNGKKYDETIFNHIYSQYGIHDKGPNQYPSLTGGSVGTYTYDWLGANGVTLSLWKYYEGALTYIYIKYEGVDRSSSRMPGILSKLNSSTL